MKNLKSSTPKPQRGTVLTVPIEKLSVGGRGVARHPDGFVIFVSDTAPGDLAEIELQDVKKNFATARLRRVVQPSPSRVVPPCPVAGVCGGCNWQHVAYDEQLKQKRLLVRESLSKFSGFDMRHEDRVQPVVASPAPLRYRNRIQLHVQNRNGMPEMGFFRRGSNSIVDVEDCLITESAITEKFPEIRRALQNQSGRFEVYRAQSDEVVWSTLQPDQGPEHGETAQEASLAFSQVNTGQNENLRHAVLAEIARIQSTRAVAQIYDLYAGSGNFTFPIAERCSEISVVGVELNADAADKALAKIKSKSIYKHIEFLKSDVEAFLDNHRITPNSIVVLDPPRIGCSPHVMELIAQSAVANVIYVSCHPVTLGRDLKVLAQNGYELDLVQPFDMFPQTDHVETLASLRKSVR